MEGFYFLKEGRGRLEVGVRSNNVYFIFWFRDFNLVREEVVINLEVLGEVAFFRGVRF